MTLISQLRSRAGELRHRATAEAAYLAPGGARTGWRRTADLAVVVHVSRPHRWADLEVVLADLPVGFDTVVTVPQHINVPPEVSRRWDEFGAHMRRVPDRGLDVLPFAQTLGTVNRLGYRFVLRLHTERVPCEDGADSRFHRVLDDLAGNRDAVGDAIKVLMAPDTGLVGPALSYLPVSHAYSANRRRILGELTRLLGGERAARVDRDPARWGFFAGSMFWARVDALSDFNRWSVAAFETERGGRETTMAHAGERLFALVPVLRGRRNWLIGSGQVLAAPYHPPDPAR